MRPFFAILLCLITLVSTGCREEVVEERTYDGEESPATPSVELASVGRIFIVGDGGKNIFGSTCFLLKAKQQTWIVGAYHSLRNAAPGDRVTLVSKIEKLAQGGKRLKVPSQSVVTFGEQPDAAGDLAGFQVSQSDPQAEPLSLASGPPRLGEPLWIVELKDSKSATKIRMSRGIATRVSNYATLVELDKGGSAHWTSGAPVVNQKGEVVGVNVGSEHGPGGSRRRVCVPWQSLQIMAGKN